MIRRDLLTPVFAATFALFSIAGPPAAVAQLACSVPPVQITHAAGSGINPNPNTLVFIDTLKYPGALCNDGTPAAFILRAGLAPSAGRWVIHLHEGAMCYDQPTCSQRWAQDTANGTKGGMLTSSLHFGAPGYPYQPAVDADMYGAPSLAQISPIANTGILSPVAKYNPDFWDATVVQVLYCSSDYFTGNKAGLGAFSGINDATWNFRGRMILNAVRQTLAASYGLRNAQEILYTGSSAGGIGTYLTVDDEALMAPPTARFVALGDAGFFDQSFPAFQPQGTVSPYLGSTAPPLMEALNTEANQLWGGRGDAYCAALAGDVQEQVQCRDPAYVVDHSYLRTPIFIAQSIEDTVQLSTDLVPLCAIWQNCHPSDPGQQMQADAYMGAFQTDLQARILGSPAPISALMVSTPDHMLTNTPRFTQTMLFSDGSSFTPAALFGAWYRYPCTQTFALETAELPLAGTGL